MQGKGPSLFSHFEELDHRHHRGARERFPPTLWKGLPTHMLVPAPVPPFARSQAVGEQCSVRDIGLQDCSTFKSGDGIFDPRNPTGHYELVLGDSFELERFEKLRVGDAPELSLRMRSGS